MQRDEKEEEEGGGEDNANTHLKLETAKLVNKKHNDHQ